MYKHSSRIVYEYNFLRLIMPVKYEQRKSVVNKNTYESTLTRWVHLL